MPEPIFIAVGGSGQHTLLAYLRLARLCRFNPAKMLLVDADVRQSGEGIPTTADLIAHQANVGFEKEVEFRPVIPLRKDRTDSPLAQTFESLVNPPSRIERELFEALFSKRQREVAVSTGFHGHPSVAASAFRIYLQDKENEIFEILNGWLAAAGRQRVVLAGSTFGGTGSGVMPMLATYLRELARHRGLDLELGGVVQVRWFDLSVPPDLTGDRAEYLDVWSQDLDRNSSCLVEFYREETEQMFRPGFLVGHHPYAVRRSAGVEKQPEHPHAVNLLAGHTAFRLLHDQNPGQAAGLWGIATPDGSLENHLQLPFGRSRRQRPLTEHLRTTSCELALGKAILNVLEAGEPGADVVEPYPRFIRELVRRSKGSYGKPYDAESGEKQEPYTTWSRLLDMQEEALRWLAAVREHSADLDTCQFPEPLLPNWNDLGEIGAHEHHLPAALYATFRSLLNEIPPQRLTGEEDEVVRRAFYAVRKQLEERFDKEGGR